MNRRKDIEEQLNYEQESDSRQKSAYETLFDSFSKLKRDDFDRDMSEEIIKKIEKKEQRKNIFFIILSISGSLLIIASILGGIFYLYGKEGFQHIQDFTGWAVLIGILVVIIQFLDHKLVRRKNEFSTQ